MKEIIENSFRQYSGAVLQSRALVDVRDCLKPSARQIFYCLYTDKFIHSKPYKKTLKAVGSAMRVYIHGDASCTGIIMRAGQPFAMRYPLIEVEGSYGTLTESANYAAPRYTASRLSSLANYLFDGIEKETIDEWRDNYDDTEQYPVVLTTKGYYNIVNGVQGIGVGAACSIPQFNLKEVNNALIKLLWNPDIDFDEIYCAPDFATGAILLNENEVKESLKNGTGFACKLRSVIEFDAKERVLVVKEIPYGVYTNTICGQLEEIVNGEENPGIEKFNDLTGETCLIKIYLTKFANPNKVLKYLYSKTSLQSHFGINFTMLKEGRYPKVYGWKQALGAHLDHELIVYRRGFEFDLNKIKHRLHIINGLIVCLENIDEVVSLIKKSSSPATARAALCEKYLLDDEQAKAVVDMKLARLTNLEVNKLIDEKEELEKEAARIQAILDNEDLLKREVEKGLIEVAEKFGDARRTQIVNIESEEDEEPKEIRSLLVSMTNFGTIFTSEVSSLYTQKRGGVGSKFKLSKGEFINQTIRAESNETIYFFTKKGNFYQCRAQDLNCGDRTNIEELLQLKSNEQICSIAAEYKKQPKKHLLIVTKNGMIKKSLIEQYDSKRSGGLKAIELVDKDEIREVLTADEEEICIMTKLGHFLRFSTKEIRPIGRTSQGVKAIKLNDGDEVTAAKLVHNDCKEIVSISADGCIKSSSIDEFTAAGRYTKGGKIQALRDGDTMVDFQFISNEAEVIVVSNKAQIKIKKTDIPTLSKGTLGVKAIGLKDGDKVIGLSI